MRTHNGTSADRKRGAGTTRTKSANGRTSVAALHQRCQLLQRERRRLLRLVKDIGAKCELYRQALTTVMRERYKGYELDERKLLGEFGRRKPLKEFITGLQAAEHAD